MRLFGIQQAYCHLLGQPYRHYEYQPHHSLPHDRKCPMGYETEDIRMQMNTI